MRCKLAISFSMLLLSACSTTMSPTKQSITKTPDAPEVRVGMASWAVKYRTLEDLVRASDVIVVGKIKGDGVPAPSTNVMHSEFELDVKKVLKDHKRRDKLDSLILRQTGGSNAVRTFEVHDDPLFKKNQHVILFLKEYEPGKVVVIGGPNGRFHIENNRLIPVDLTGIQMDLGTTPQVFTDNVESVVKTGKKLNGS